MTLAERRKGQLFLVTAAVFGVWQRDLAAAAFAFVALLCADVLLADHVGGGK